MPNGISDSEPMVVVLVVEDDFLLRWNLSDHLREAGYVVEEAESAQRAIEFCHDGTRIDILITDIQLSDRGSGWDVAEAFQPGTLAQTTISDSSRNHPMSPEKPRRYWLSDQGLSS